jgi:hypothetical protein
LAGALTWVLKYQILRQIPDKPTWLVTASMKLRIAKKYIHSITWADASVSSKLYGSKQRH